MRPSQLPPSPLPLMWQLYPGRRYRGSDSSFWHIVYHIQASVCFCQGPVGSSWVALLPLPHVWPLQCICSLLFCTEKKKKRRAFTTADFERTVLKLEVNGRTTLGGLYQKPPQPQDPLCGGQSLGEAGGRGPWNPLTWVLPAAPIWWKAGSQHRKEDPHAPVSDPLLSAVQRRRGLAP